MKKLKVKYIIAISLGILALFLLISTLSIAFGFRIFLKLSAVNVFTICIAASWLTGLVTTNDLNKEIGGEIIDENQYLRWSNLLQSRWIATFLIQLIFIIFNPLLIKYFYTPFYEGFKQNNGLNESNSPDLPFISLIFTFSPTLIFIFGGFISKINKSDEELIKLKRRDRIRTSDLSELNNKVDLSKWISNDYVLQVDKELFSKLVLVNVELLKLADSSLLRDKEFLLRLIKINYGVISQIDFKLFEEDDFDKDFVLNIIHQFHTEQKKLHRKNNAEKDVAVDFAVFQLTIAPIPFDSIITRIIEIYQTSDFAKDRIAVFSYYEHLRDEITANRLNKYKLCDNSKHILLKTDSTCCYCE